jgi:hypothetical protein
MPRRRHALGLLLLLALFQSFLPQPALSQLQEGATLTVLRGQVALVRPDGSAVQPAPSGTVVHAGDEIRTLSATGALITFFAGTEIELGADTILVVDRVSRQGERVDVSLKQVFGATLNRVQTLADPASAYRVEAGGAVAVVRGTTFSLLGPFPTARGNVVVLVCLEDCDRLTTFAGVPVAPFTGFFVEVDGGRAVGPVHSFKVDPAAGYWQNLWEGATIFEQLEQGDTRGVPAGQVPAGQQAEVRGRLEREERERDQRDEPPPGPVPAGTATVTATPTGPGPDATATPTATPTATVTPPTGPLPQVSVTGGGSRFEGGAFTFTVTLSRPSSQVVTIDFAAADTPPPPSNACIPDPQTCDPATGGSDYVPTSGRLTFNPGETSKTVTVQSIDDTRFEADREYVAVTLSAPVNAMIGTGQGLGEIFDNESATVSITDVTVIEGQVAAFTITMSPDRDIPVNFQYFTQDNNASAGSDFIAVSGGLTFDPGETTETVVVQTLDDGAPELTELFSLRAFPNRGRVLGDNAGIGTIVDND